ncbi:energy-coupling factor ABC transporter ATP-binding protein [Thiococcus pfennigii]|uniref:energy-coupling factor ABC transporter ATP-binding protein n=1 Tax=Thiococcus pfennigii TaxID=1057 RepID=UPI001905B9A7|nr:ABC transporter ATP-binding protein [Thiococcus pfennigii]MBK1730385.1 cobalt ABC transporter ATP-binding protein [Thiococcus pfennigii]
MSAPLLALRGVTCGYPGRTVLREADLEIAAGERLALVGANGSGKTTLLHLLVGLHPPSAGRVIAFGTDCRDEADFIPVRRRVGLVFQDADDQLFCPTVLEDVAFGPLNLGLSVAEARAVAEETLATLGLAGLAGRVTHRLSGGEKRLVALATVLAMRPEVLLLDEPTTGLDEATERRLVEHLAGLPQAMLFVSHDRALVARLATRVILLGEGRLRPASVHVHPHTHVHAHIHPLEGAAGHGHEAPAGHTDHHRTPIGSGSADLS